MRLALGNLKIDLTKEINENDIQKLIDQVNALQKGLEEALHETVRDLAYFGELYAAENAVASSTGYNESDVGHIVTNMDHEYNPETHVGQVLAYGDEAVYYEYGTGIVGAYAPHPGLETGESHPPVMQYGSRTYTKYDTYGHGYNGWDYYDPETRTRVHTIGQVAHAFMYKTMKQLEEEAPAKFRMNMYNVHQRVIQR